MERTVVEWGVQAVKEPGQGRIEQMVERLVHQIGRWHLTLPSLFLLEVARPFAFIASQGLLLCQPLLSFLEIGPQVGETAELLAEPSSLELLIARLEQETRTHKVNGRKED
jgi:hypothetical protein